MTHTHTYAQLEVSAAAHDEIAGKLIEAGYDCIRDGVIDMHGIGLVRSTDAPVPSEPSAEILKRFAPLTLMDESARHVSLNEAEHQRHRTLTAALNGSECGRAVIFTYEVWKALRSVVPASQPPAPDPSPADAVARFLRHQPEPGGHEYRFRLTPDEYADLSAALTAARTPDPSPDAIRVIDHTTHLVALEEAAIALMQMQKGPGEPRREEARAAVEAYLRSITALSPPASPATGDALREAIADLLKAVRWWAAQEDGIPDEVWGAYMNGCAMLGWAIDGTLATPATGEPYTIQTISDPSAPDGVHYRITDSGDSRVATCYLLENAEVVCAALNATGEPKGDVIRGHLFSIRSLSNGHPGIISVVNQLARRLGVEPPNTPLSERLAAPADTSGR